MKRLALVSFLVVLGAVLPSAAHAKGPSAALIEGPGLNGAITIGYGDPGGGSASAARGYGEAGSEASVIALAEQGGFFPAVFGQTPDPMSKTQPSGRLGPRYTIVFTVPGPNGLESTIVQDVYPYATSGPVTYTKPGQRFWDGQLTYGGWYRAASNLKQALVSDGLPRTAPGAATGWTWTRTLLVAIGAAIALAAILLLARRRLQPTSAQHPQAI